MYSYDRRQLVAVKAAPKGKVLALFEPFLKEHDEYIRKWVTDDANDLRDKALKLYPHPTSSKHGFGRTFRERVQWDAWVEKNGEAQLKETIEANRINQYRESVPPHTEPIDPAIQTPTHPGKQSCASYSCHRSPADHHLVRTRTRQHLGLHRDVVLRVVPNTRLDLTLKSLGLRLSLERYTHLTHPPLHTRPNRPH